MKFVKMLALATLLLAGVGVVGFQAADLTLASGGSGGPSCGGCWPT